jgi:hypothetical protein
VAALPKSAAPVPTVLRIPMSDMHIKAQIIEAQVKYAQQFADLWKPFNSTYQAFSSRKIESEKAVNTARARGWPAIYDRRRNQCISNFFSDPRMPAHVGLERLCGTAAMPEIQTVLDYRDLNSTFGCMTFQELYMQVEACIHAPEKVWGWDSPQQAYKTELLTGMFSINGSAERYRWLWGTWFYEPDLLSQVVRNEFVAGPDFHIFDIVIWCLYKRRCSEVHGENNPHDEGTTSIYQTAYEALEPYVKQLGE